MIIDGHCHYGTGIGFTNPYDTSASLTQYLKRAQSVGIDRTVLFSLSHPDYQQANHHVAQLTLKHPEQFFGFACVHPAMNRGQVKAIVSKAVEVYGFRGIKVHRIDARITREICQVANAFDIPILYDIMGEVVSIDLLAREYPEVRFIVPHMGSFNDNWQVQTALIDQMVKHKNVYADTSAVRRFDVLLEAVRRCGAKKIVFGTDGPWLHPGLELMKIRALPISEHEKELICAKNILRLMNESEKSS